MSRPDSVPVAKPAVAEISRSRLSTLSRLRIRVACRLTARGNVVSGSCGPKNGDDPPSDVSGGRATAEANPDEVVSSMASHTDVPPAAVDRDINGSTSFGDLKRQRERAGSARPTIGLASASPPLPLLLERASKICLPDVSPSRRRLRWLAHCHDYSLSAQRSPDSDELCVTHPRYRHEGASVIGAA